MTGASALVQALKGCGVDTVFGVPGTQSITLFEALAGQSDLRTILASDEGSAGFMAHGYFRASGRLACVATIPGPGLTNALTAVAESREDSVALVHIVVTESIAEPGPFELQPTYLKAMSPHIYKKAFSISCRSELVQITERACRHALAGEPGPVLLAVTFGALKEEGGFESEAQPAPGDSQLEESLGVLAQRLAASGRICLFVGQGAADCAASLQSLIDATGALVMATASGRGTVPDDHPRMLCGDFGGWGAELANQVLAQSELVLAVGCKFTHNGSGAYTLKLAPATLVRIDTSEEVLAAGYPASLNIVADARTVLERVVQLLKARPYEAPRWTEQERSDWRERFSQARARSVRHQSDLVDWPGHQVSDFFAALRDTLSRDSHVVADSGQHQVWARQHYPVLASRGLFFPTDFQSMGFALPVAMGAKVARPEKPVLVVVGDGGFQMSGLCLATAVKERIPLTVVVFNDGALSQIKFQQWREFGRDFATTPGSVSFAAMASALGVEYALLTGDPRQAIAQAMHSGTTTLLELRLTASASIAKAAMVARAKAVVQRGPGMTLLLSYWRRLKTSR